VLHAQDAKKQYSYLIDEMSQHLQSRDFGLVMTGVLDSVFDVFLSSLRPSFGLPPVSSEAAAEGAPADDTAQVQRVVFAKLFPVIAKQARSLPALQSQDLQDAVNLPLLDAYCAAVYSAITR